MRDTPRVAHLKAMLTHSPLAELSQQPDRVIMPDEVLLRQFIETSDRDCFELLLRRYQYEIYNYLRKYLGDEDLAEDAFQLTFVNVFRKCHQFDFSRRFRPWLYGIATHQAIDVQRSQGRRRCRSLDAPINCSTQREITKAEHVADHRSNDEGALERAELRQQMMEALNEVGEPGRSAIELVYLQGMPYKDAAQRLNVPVGTVKSRVHAAVRKLATVWQRTMGNKSDQ